MKQIFFLLLFVLLTINSYGDLRFSSGDKQNTLIELYTSEGCSSCPPAEAWLNAFKNHPKLFSQIIPLAFHVDYWDSLGWRDLYAKYDYSVRQKIHHMLGNISAVYTPGIVKNAKEFRYWRDTENSKQAQKIIGALSVKLSNNWLDIYFNSQINIEDTTLNVALFGADLVSSIVAGENANRTLYHDFVVLTHKTYHSTKNNQKYWSLPLPKTKIKAPRYGLAIWLTPKDSLTPIQATAAWLSDDLT